MSTFIALVIKNWHFIVIGLMALTIAGLTGQLVKSYKTNGGLAEQVRNEQRANRELGKQMALITEGQIAHAEEESKSYAACVNAAAASDSSAFKKGVEAGKIIGRREQCAPSSTSPPAQWPASRPPLVQPTTPQ